MVFSLSIGKKTASSWASQLPTTSAVMTTEQYPAWVPCVHSRNFPVGLKPTILFHCTGRETHWAVCWVGQDKFWGQASSKTIKGPETGSPRVSAPSYTEMDQETSTPRRQSRNRTSPYLTPDHMRRPLITPHSNRNCSDTCNQSTLPHATSKYTATPPCRASPALSKSQCLIHATGQNFKGDNYLIWGS